MSKIFVTGATGLIGIKLVQRLKEEGHEVAGFTTSENGQQKLAAVNVKAYIGDILKADTIDQALADFKPEIIINQITDLKNVDMAANTKVRIEGSKNLIDAAKKHDVKKVIAQSIAFMYEPGEGLANEETSLDFNSTGDRKVTVDGVVGLEEETARMDEYVVLRFGWLYGPGTWYGKDGMIYNQFMDGHKGSEFAEWYKEQLGVEPNIDIQPAQPFERGVSNEKFKAQGGTLIYQTWKDGMNPIK
ncbi:TPA: NAD(P)-dependent oxidoreductase [Staphylococcus aureus]|nr:NAD(P)-dependent oxidoreductase [Staphylococcus aureus]